jgi:hypothetical protein
MSVTCLLDGRVKPAHAVQAADVMAPPSPQREPALV